MARPLRLPVGSPGIGGHVHRSCCFHTGDHTLGRESPRLWQSGGSCSGSQCAEPVPVGSRSHPPLSSVHLRPHSEYSTGPHTTCDLIRLSGEFPRCQRDSSGQTRDAAPGSNSLPKPPPRAARHPDLAPGLPPAPARHPEPPVKGPARSAVSPGSGFRGHLSVSRAIKIPLRTHLPASAPPSDPPSDAPSRSRTGPDPPPAPFFASRATFSAPLHERIVFRPASP